MSALDRCLGRIGKAFADIDRREIEDRVGRYVGEGLAPEFAAERAVTEQVQKLGGMLEDAITASIINGVDVSRESRATAPQQPAQSDPIDDAEPMRFAAEAMAILGEINEVYRAPEIPKSANTIEKAVRAGIPGATKTEKLDEIVKMGGVDPVAGSNTPEAAQPGAYYRVVGEARFRAATYLMPPNPSTGASGGEFTIKEYLPSETFPSGALEVDVSRLGTGNAGAMVYNAVAGLAAAKGMPFRADSAGLTTWGAIRRTVTMTNAAMRYGVQFVEPGERQLSPSREMKRVGITPLQWEVRGVGKTVGRNEGGSERSKQNFANLLRAESQSVRQVIGDVLDQYGFDWQALRFTKNGEPVSFAAGSPEIEALVQRGVESFNAAGVAPDNPVASGGAARPQGASPPYGRASIARAVLVQSLVRAEGQGGRRAILDRLGALVAESRAGRDAGVESSVPRDLRNLWSQQPSKVENPVPTRQRALRILTRAWGPDIQALMAQGKLRLVSLAEAKALTNNAPGIETAKGWYVDGVAHVIYDNNTADEIAGTALHEAGVHLAAPRLLGAPLYDTLTNALVQQAQSGDADPRVARAFAAANQALVDANGNQIADADSIRHETLAYLTEFNPGHGTVRRLLDSFMAVLNAMGFDLRSLESDTDLTLRVMRDALRAEARGLTGDSLGYQGGTLLSVARAPTDSEDPRRRAQQPTRREMRGGEQQWRQQALDRRAPGQPGQRLQPVEWNLRFSQRVEAATKDPKFKKWSEGLPVVKAGSPYEGRPAVLEAYHGSTHGDIEIFKQVGNMEGVLGPGPYFTTTPEDASRNYAGIGADLASRIEQLAEEMARNTSERELLEEYFDANPDVERPYSGELDDDEAYDLFQEYGTIAAYDAAKRQLVGKAGGVVYPVFIKTKNPASISRRQPTKISGAEQAKKWREAMQRIDKEMFNGQMADVIDSIMEDVEPYVDMSGGVPHHDVYDMMRLRVPYLSTEEGQPISPAAVFRYVAEAAGHDAVVMDAGSTFNFMPGLTPNTVHVVPFVSEHIKSALGNKKYSLKEKRFMFSQRTPGQKELLRKTGMPIDDRGLITRSVDAVRREWQRMQDSWYGGTDARIQWTADRFRGIGAAEEEIERRIGRKLDANERSYVMSRMNLGLPSIMDAVLQYGAPRFEDQTWTQWADVTFPDGSSIEVYEQAPNRRAAMDALAMKYSGAAISLKRKPTTPVPGAPERTGNTGSTTGVFVRNEDTKGLIDALRPVADDLNGWLAWMVVQRAKKLKAEGRENLLTDADIKAGDALADTPEKKRAFEKAAEDYTKIKEAILDVAEQAGTISREAREAWDHAEYIPFFRQDVDKDDVIGPRLRKRMTDTRPGIRVLKGGEQVLADPMGNIVRNFAKLLDSSMKNVALERLVTNLSLNVEDADAIRARLATFTKNVKPAQIQRAFAKVGLYDPATGQFTQGKTEFSRSDLREALRSVGISSEQINKAMGTADADSVFFQRVNMEVTRALVPMSAVIQSLLDDGVPQTVIDAMPPAALKGMREMMAFKMPQAPDVFMVMREGKATVYRANDPLLVRSLAGMQPRERGALLRFFSAPARFVTGMITRDPVFMVRNLTRDVLQNWTIAEVNYNPIISTVNGVARSMMETGGAIDMMFAGASFHRGHAQVHDPDATANAIRRVLRSKGMTRQQIDTTVERVTQSIVDFGRNGLEKWDRVGSAVENATREAVYEAAIRAGMSRAEANYMARDVMDFGLRGDSSLINTLADVLPFFNARIQGLYKLYRAGAIPGMGPKMRAAVMGRAMMLVGFSAGLMAMNLALFAEGYDELEEWDKDTYWHLAPGTAAHVRIPKPFEIGLLFGTIPERMLRAIQNQMTEGESGDAPKATLLSAWGGIWNTLGMNPIPQAILPAFEVWMLNRSMFTGRPIENLGDQKQPKSDVGEWYTSPIADKVAEAINAPLEGLGLGPRVGVSAKQIEHLWRGYTGTIGAYALSAADMIVNRLSDSPVAADDFTDWALSVAPADIPFIPGRSTRPIAEILSDGNLADGGTPRNYRQSAEFYALYDQVTVVAAGIKAQMERAQKAYDEGELDLAEQAEAEAMRRYEANAGLLGPMEEATTKSGLADKRVKGGVRFENQTAMNQAVKALRDTRDEIELVMTNPELSAVEQKRRVEEISVRRKQVIDEMLQKIRESKVQTAKEDE